MRYCKYLAYLEKRVFSSEYHQENGVSCDRVVWASGLPRFDWLAEPSDNGTGFC